jgi:hypothetical protein
MDGFETDWHLGLAMIELQVDDQSQCAMKS